MKKIHISEITVILCISGVMYNVQLEIGIYAFENEDSERRTRVFCPQETSATGIADRWRRMERPILYCTVTFENALWSFV